MLKIKAAVTLPIVLLIAGAFMAYYLSQSGLGVKLSEEALAAARAGIQDVRMRIVRDKSFTPSSNPYILTVGNRTTQITVCKDSCAGTGKFQITSLGMALTKRRQVQSIISVDSLTGEVKIESEKEIAI